MKRLDRYIALNVLQSVAVVALVLLALFAFAAFAGELRDVGRGSYDAATAALYSLLMMPQRLYQLFPIIVLLGAIIGLGAMASHGELVAIRAAGLSIGRIVGSVMRLGVVLMVVMVAVGEFVAPAAETRAQSLKAEALDQKVSLRGSGLWVRDGDRVIHVRNLLSPRLVGDVTIYRFDEHNRLRALTRAKTARFDGHRWHLESMVRSQIAPDGVTTERRSEAEWPRLLDPEVLDVVTIEPEMLSLPGLHRYIGYLEENGLDADPYQLALWRKIVSPLVTLVMILVAVPFVFGPLRSTGVGQRIFLGTLVGIGFYLIDQTLGQMGLVWGIPPLLAVLLSPLVFTAGAGLAIRRL